MKTVGAEKCIISSDLGQAYHCPPAEGMRMLIGILLRLGLSVKEVELMAKVNPAKLLGL
jgi:imidazolonepropionase-like amidohydrolase